jgi:hypothetical protein
MGRNGQRRTNISGLSGLVTEYLSCVPENQGSTNAAFWPASVKSQDVMTDLKSEDLAVE